MRIQRVQLLRAVAALSVIFGHALSAAARMGSFERPTIPTGIGVDLFFAISGFIMVISSNRLFAQTGATRTFLTNRAIRVVPLYWLCTSALLAMVISAGRGADGLPGTGYILSSYAFIPNASFGSVDGVAFPLLSLGWTLNYEALFYVVFSMFLLLPRHLATAGVQAVMLVAVLLGLLLSPSSVVLSTWTQPIVLEFALGLLVGNAYLDGLRIRRRSGWMLLALAAIWVALDPCHLTLLQQTPSDFRRLVGWGLPGCMILAAVVLGPQDLPTWAERPSALLGDASYSLYLTHPFVLIALEKVWHRYLGSHVLWMFITMAIVLAVAFSLAITRWIERPINQALRRKRRSPAPRVAAPSPSG